MWQYLANVILSNMYLCNGVCYYDNYCSLNSRKKYRLPNFSTLGLLFFLSGHLSFRPTCHTCQELVWSSGSLGLIFSKLTAVRTRTEIEREINVVYFWLLNFERGCSPPSTRTHATRTHASLTHSVSCENWFNCLLWRVMKSCQRMRIRLYDVLHFLRFLLLYYSLKH